MRALACSFLLVFALSCGPANVGNDQNGSAGTGQPGRSHRLPSGPLHDAAEVARAGVPTVMLFVQSLRGLSHTKLEDTREEHLELSVQALDRLADKAIARVAGTAG